MKENRFPENLKKLRQMYDLSMDELSSHISVSKQSISKYEKGLIEPNFHTLVELAKLFDCSLDYLIFGNVSKMSVNPLEIKNFLFKKVDIFKDEMSKFIDKSFEYENLNVDINKKDYMILKDSAEKLDEIKSLIENLNKK